MTKDDRTDHGLPALSLDGAWRLQHFDDGVGANSGVYRAECDDSEWLPATVPGQVQADLHAGGLIPDPFFGLNYEQCLWVEQKEWWYRRCFIPRRDELPGRRIELTFGGLDTFATVYLNGEKLGESANMWVPVVFDVTDRLRWDELNVLAIRLRSSFAAVQDAMAADDTPEASAFFSPRERLYARKAQMSYGWDISPRIVSVGIWRPVNLVAVPAVAIRDFWTWTESASEEKATLGFEINCENLTDQALEVDCTLQAACENSAIVWEERLSLAPGRQVLRGSLDIASPLLWWPHEVGPQHLYRGTVSVAVAGDVFHVKHCAFGIRKVDLVLKEPATGENRFHFTVNGVPVFIRGTNWMPTDAMFFRETRDRVRAVLELVRDCHNHMVRIWGGGVYESAGFYELCDELGIMVWQDFMYACGLYPQNEAFLAQARAEAEWVVPALRGHPCLVLWAGDNENDCAYGWSEGEPDRYLKNRITRQVLPEVCARLDPTRPYIPSSPYNPSGHGDPNSADEGDVHLWDHSKRPRDPMYFQDRSKFLSEIGRICAANLSTTRRFLAPEDQWPPQNQAWEHHVGTIPTCDFERRLKTDLGIRNLIGRDAESLEEYIAASQYGQAWCLGEWIERARRRKPECSGILWWNIFDNWPQHVDAVVDYYFGKKVGYAAVQRACRPLLPSICRADDALEVWLLNDLLGPSSGMLTLSVHDLSGSSYIARVEPVAVAANTSACVARIPLAELGDLDADAQYLHVLYEPTDGDAIENWHILDDARDLAVFEAVYGPPNP